MQPRIAGCDPERIQGVLCTYVTEVMPPPRPTGARTERTPIAGGGGRLLALGLLDDLFRDVLRNLGVAAEDHRVDSATGGAAAQVADVAEHLGQRDERPDDLDAGGVLHGLDLSTAGVEVADDVAHVLLGRAHLDVHDRLEQHRIGLACGLLVRDRPGDLERHLRGVDVVVRAVEQDRADPDRRVAGEHADLHRVLDAGVDRGDVLAGDAATADRVLELVRGLGGHLHGLERDLHLGELAGATRLLLVRVVVLLDRLLDGLAVRHLRLADVRLDLELPLHAVDQDVEVELAHALDDGLAGLLVLLGAERRVLFGELLDRRAELLLVGLGLRLDGDLDDRLRERHRLEDDLVVGVGQGVTGGGVLQADDRVDVAGGDRVDRVLLVGVHLEDLADALLAALGRVDDLSAGLEATRVDADVGEPAEERVRDDLERERGEGLRRVGVTLDDLLLVAHVVALDRGHVERRREVVHDRVEHRLDAAVLERRTAHDGVDLALDGELADRALDLLGRELLAAEVLLEQRVVGLGDRLHQLVAVLLGPLAQVGRDLLDLVGGAEGHVALRVAGPDQGAHVDEVDDADEVALRADGQLDDQRLRAEALDDGVDRVVKVGAELVHLVDEADARHVVLVGLAPHRLGLGLNALLAVEHGDRAVEHTERALHLDREVHVAGGVDDVDLVVRPEARGRGGRDRDAALLLLRHPVHRGGAVVDLADLVGDAGVVEDALGRGGLAGIDVRHDADVADLIQVGEHVECHRGPPGSSKVVALGRTADRGKSFPQPAAIPGGAGYFGRSLGELLDSRGLGAP